MYKTIIPPSTPQARNQIFQKLRLNEFVTIFSARDRNGMHEPDRQLIERVRKSDQEAFRFLFEKYQPLLFRNIVYTLQDVDTAHDIVQETFVRVWNRRASLQPDLPFLSLLFTISRNFVLDRAKHMAVQNKYEAEVGKVLLPESQNPEEALHVKLLEERIVQIVRSKLPPRCREIFLLSRMEGMSHAEIGQHLGVGIKTVENQMTRALKIVRRHLRRYL
jgi:RNA polymerase sigma-70 factor (ECF subfamily)